MFGIEMSGFTKLINSMKAMSDAVQPAFGTMTNRTGKQAFERYKDNLSGAVPSTADSPLPVGTDTGDLLEGAHLTIEDAENWKLHNFSEHAGYIEDGTEFITPRRPMQDAIDGMDKDFQKAADTAMETITSAEGSEE